MPRVYKKNKIENLEKEFDSQTKLINMKLNDLQSTFGDKLKKFNTLQNIEEIQFINDETQIVVNAKLFLDINRSIEDIKINLKYLEQDVKNKFLEKKKEIILDAAKLVEEQQTILRNHFERNLISELEKCKKSKPLKMLYNYCTTKDCLTHLKTKTKSLMSSYTLQMNTCWKNTEKKYKHQMVYIIYLI